MACALALSPFSSEIAYADQEIGNTQVVVNDVKGVIGTQEPAVLHADIDVFQNEVVRAGEKSASRVKFQDNTDLSGGASSEVTLDHFVFDPDPRNRKCALSIAKGEYGHDRQLAQKRLEVHHADRDHRRAGNDRDDHCRA